MTKREQQVNELIEHRLKSYEPGTDLEAAKQNELAELASKCDTFIEVIHSKLIKE